MRKPRTRFTALLLTFSLCIAAAAAGCGSKSGSSSAASEVSSAQAIPVSSENTASSNHAVSAVSSQASSAADSAASNADTAVSQTNGIEAAPESNTSSVPTKDDRFNKKWAANPIDAAMQKAMDTADTNRKIVETYTQYAQKWQNEIAVTYDRLMTVSGNDAALKSEQTAWVNGKEAQLQKIKASVASEGTGAAVGVGSKVMQFYRARAQQLYFELYKYDPNFSFTNA